MVRCRIGLHRWDQTSVVGATYDIVGAVNRDWQTAGRRADRFGPEVGCRYHRRVELTRNRKTMGVPLSQMWTVASYVLTQKIRGRKQYPLVLMLEPLFRCNLACAGCGKIQYPAHVLKKNLTPEQCFKAVDECGAPMVSIPGGEPLLHPQIKEIVEGLVSRQEVHLPVHQRPAAEGKDRPVQAQQVSSRLAFTWTGKRITTILPCAGKARTTWRWTVSARR